MVQYSPFIYAENIVVMRGSPFIYKENILMVKYSPSIHGENISVQKRCGCLLVLVVAVGGNDVHMYFCVEDFIYEPMFLCNAATPLACTVASERLRLSSTGTGMVH